MKLVKKELFAVLSCRQCDWKFYETTKTELKKFQYHSSEYHWKCPQGHINHAYDDYIKWEPRYIEVTVVEEEQQQQQNSNPVGPS